ncbi:MAG: diaminopimelate decarboxylase [Pyrinomonadaceae bacterium]|nr:diaminopimelate decarboxylase [Pyrinomonadaceae bacterium]
MTSSTNTNPSWTIENFLEVNDNGLRIDGVSAIELTENYETPLFVFSEARIRHNIERLKRAETAMNQSLKVCYAAKANSNMAILRAVKDAGSDLEVNSGGELYKALKVGFRPDQIIFNGVSKSEKELTEAINAGIYAIQCDSVFELDLIASVAEKLEKRANVSLRLVPDIETNTLHGLQTAKQTSKFGITAQEIPACFAKYGLSEFVNLCGMHIHLGSQTPDSAPFGLAFETLFEFLKKIHEDFNVKLSHINIGGGFPVNYLRDESNSLTMNAAQRELFKADLEPSEILGAEFSRMKEAAKSANAEHLLRDLTILIEPGRSIIADAGIILTKVCNSKTRQIKDSANETDEWLLTDAGYNIMLSIETYKWYYHLISASRAGEQSETPYKVAGPLCDGGDVYFDIEGANRLPDYRLLPANVKPNEILALLNVGAYSMAQMFPYNARPLPAAVLIRENGEVELIRKRDEYATLIESDIW